MPNWAEGSLKLRGRSENIASANKEDTINDISDFLEQCSTLRELQDKLMEYFDLQDC